MYYDNNYKMTKRSIGIYLAPTAMTNCYTHTHSHTNTHSHKHIESYTPKPFEHLLIMEKYPGCILHC